MVQVLFRHGERTTDHFYPKDPHKDLNFYPTGRGNLTNKGKAQAYNLGLFLRNRYDEFLGPYHSFKTMEVLSTEFTRTRASALLVTAGLWPPKSEQNWNEELPWMPIPIDYKISQDDHVSKKLRKIFEIQPDIPEVKKLFIDPYKDLYNRVAQESGLNVRSPIEMLSLYTILQTEKESSNLKLPDWTNGIFPEPMYRVASLVYRYMNYQPEIINKNTAEFMKKVIAECTSKVRGEYKKDEKKIILYAAHEKNLGVILDLLKIPPHIPSYTSAIIFELHKNLRTSRHEIKLLYKREIGDCALEDVFFGQKSCPLDAFMERMRKIIEPL